MTTQHLGARWDGEGVDFRLTAPDAEGVELCLFDESDFAVETRRIPLDRDAEGEWSTRVTGTGPGQLYGYRVDGDHRPAAGLRFDPAKLLIDPRAGAVAGDPVWHPSLLARNHQDSGAVVPRSVVIDPSFDWQGVERPRVPWKRTVIYECHVRGLTRLHPQIPRELRGTYLGLIQPPVLEHLKALGVTTLELLPVHHFASERHLLETGRRNYWGYSPIAWFAPHGGYATACRGEQVQEFQTMVRELHRAGFEVLLDVVLNHSAEGDENGTILGPRGLDNQGFYRLRTSDPARYADFTGCGNTLDLRCERTRRLLVDSLRHWAEVLGVDGFRFDLAPVLGRADPNFSATAPFFRDLADDPLLAPLKLIAEAWDLGPDGYCVGRFPNGWHEWNDRFRKTMRAFWRGDRGLAAELATRLAGSQDLFAGRTTGRLTGVNYVTCHDGFTLQDLVSYRHKHNEANGEGNRDGAAENLSHNWGIEGPTDDPAVSRRRLRARKNFLATLAFSAGIPMVGHGDEMGRSQRGNNNAYCQDSPLTWVDWELGEADRDLLRFAGRAFRLRRELGLSSDSEFFSDQRLRWYRPDGQPITGGDWRSPELGTLLMLRSPAAAPLVLTIFCADPEPPPIILPPTPDGHRWRLRLATAPETRLTEDGGSLRLPGYSLALLSSVDGAGDSASAALPEDAAASSPRSGSAR